MKDMMVQIMEDDNNYILKELERLRLSHYVNQEDCWYSCPNSGKCCNDYEPDKCNCGADIHNQILDNLIEFINGSKCSCLKINDQDPACTCGLDIGHCIKHCSIIKEE